MGNLKLLIVNLQDNTGLCHYVIYVRETSVVRNRSNKRELEVMKSFKYKFSSTVADCVAKHHLLELYFLRNFFCGIYIGSTQFVTYFQCAIADSSVREVEFCTIVPYTAKNFLHMQTERECLRTKINTQQRVV